MAQIDLMEDEDFINAKNKKAWLKKAIRQAMTERGDDWRERSEAYTRAYGAYVGMARALVWRHRFVG